MKRIRCRCWGFIVVAGGLSLWAPSTRAADENLQPVARWSFEDHGAGVMDGVGKHNGTVMGALMPAPGVAGKALRFDGRSDVVAPYREVLTPATIQTLAEIQTIPHTLDVVEPVKIWDGGVVPNSAEIPVLHGVTFHVIKRHEPETDGYHWLHGVGLVWHKGRLYASFGHNKGSENTRGEEARGRVSDDAGQTWGEPFTIASGNDSLGVSHGVFLSHQGSLWSFHGAFCDQFQRTHTRAYVLDEATGRWQAQGVVVDAGFWPLQEPQKMEDGNWIMAGARISHGYDVVGDLPAVAISHGVDFTRWDLVVIPCDDRVPVRSIWGESNVIVNGPRITSLARWGHTDPTTLVSESTDYGRTWSPVQASNLLMADSKPCAGTLSNGQRYLIGTTTADSGRRRSPLTIAVSRPGERHFSKLFVIRHAVLEGGPDSQDRSALSYPYAVEHAGKLYVGYSNSGGRGGNHNSAELAIIPLESL